MHTSQIKFGIEILKVFSVAPRTVSMCRQRKNLQTLTSQTEPTYCTPLLSLVFIITSSSKKVIFATVSQGQWDKMSDHSYRVLESPKMPMSTSPMLCLRTPVMRESSMSTMSSLWPPNTLAPAWTSLAPRTGLTE